MEERYGIEDLAELGGVTRRTVRYYVQEELLPAPLGVGRGRHYGPEHLERLLQVKSLQEQGLPLSEIRRRFRRPRPTDEPEEVLRVARSSWTRLTLLPGVELNLASGVRLPAPSKVEELAEWCRRHFRMEEDVDAED
jgi:DNA-binding transcriptional MerR regulator